MQSLLLLALSSFFIAHFVLLSPAGLEEDFNGVRVIHPRDLLNFLKNEPQVIARNIPTDVAPSYSIRNMDFYSSIDSKPNWHMTSRKSNLYQKQEIIHSRDARLNTYDGTVVEAKEMVMWQKEDRTELYGDVVMYFTNGLTLKAQYAEVKQKPEMFVTIPLTEKVIGDHFDASNRIHFESYGMTYTQAGTQDARLLSKVETWIYGTEITHIKSDYALYQHKLGLLNFQMYEKQALDRQFVVTDQPDLIIRSRSQEIQLVTAKSKTPPTSHDRSIEKITAFGDVQLKDSHDPLHPSTGTGGKGIYYEANNEIHLSDFPQVYQDSDTITGDSIIYLRNQDLIQVKQSNAIYDR